MEKNIEKEIVEEICTKYGRSERLIKLMAKYTLSENYTLKETKNLIENFYNAKSMQ